MKTFILYLRSEFVKFFYGNGTVVFTVNGWDSMHFSSSLQQISFGESKNIELQVRLMSKRSYIKIVYGTLRQGLDSGRENNRQIRHHVYDKRSRDHTFPASFFRLPFVLST